MRTQDFEARYFEDFQSDLQEDIVTGAASMRVLELRHMMKTVGRIYHVAYPERPPVRIQSRNEH